MVQAIDKDKGAFALLKHAVLCYRRLADYPRYAQPTAAHITPGSAQESLRKCLPSQLRDNTFQTMLACPALLAP